MSKCVFRNYNLESIKALLKEIGKERYECALRDIGLIDSKPITMKGFYIEYEVDTKDINLYYRYPSGTLFLIMSVLGFWNVPIDNWVRKREKI